MTGMKLRLRKPITIPADTVFGTDESSQAGFAGYQPRYVLPVLSEGSGISLEIALLATTDSPGFSEWFVPAEFHAFRVGNRTNWAADDYLGPRQIADGDSVELLFPDGHREEVCLRLEVAEMALLRPGDTIVVRKAYYELNIHGVTVRGYVRNHEGLLGRWL
jgi:hypothetical protein